MKPVNRIIAKTVLIFTILIVLSSFASAITIGDGFRGGLLSVNNFFSGQQFQPYAKTIDFVFFALFFTAVYMMGARYAFKEMKRPEQVIVILLGLMTAFLLVLAGWSATILLPYIHWLFYILLFAFYFWLLKGIKSKFWRFLLALLLTLLTIWLLSLLTAGFIAPDTSGYVGPFFESLKGISFPELPKAPGIPSAITDLFSQPSAPPTGPSTLPPAPIPTGGKGFFDFLKDWWWLLLLLLLLLLGGMRFLRRRHPPETPPEGNVDEIKSKIEETIQNKIEAIGHIITYMDEKNSILQAQDKRTHIIGRIATIEPANLYTDPVREQIEQEGGGFKEFKDKEEHLIGELIKLKKVEVELFKKLDEWVPIIQRINPNININNINSIVSALKIIIAQKRNTIQEARQMGVVWLIALCYNIEKRAEVLSKETEHLLGEDNLEELVKDRFGAIKANVDKLTVYNSAEIGLIKLLKQKIEEQINRLRDLLRELGGTSTTPTTPVTPNQPTGPTVDPKFDPTFDPTKIKFEDPAIIKDPVRPNVDVIFEPVEPPKLFIDLSPYFQRVKNQLDLMSCVSFATGSIFEYLHKAKLNKGDVDVSELFIYYYSRVPNVEANVGTFKSNACQVLLERGDCLGKLWSYGSEATGRYKLEPSKEAQADASQRKIISAHYVVATHKEALVRTLSHEYPISISILIKASFLNAKAYYEPNLSESNGGGHCIVIVGYKSDYKTPDGRTVEAFKIRNSYGEGWGEGGYSWVHADLLLELIRERGDPPRIMTEKDYGKKLAKTIEIPYRPLQSPGTVRIKATTNNGREPWSGMLNLEITEPLVGTSTGEMEVPTGFNNMTPGIYKIKYISGGPSSNVRNPEQEKELKTGQTIEFIFDFISSAPGPKTEHREPPKRPLSSPGTVRINATTDNSTKPWSGELELEITEPLSGTSKGLVTIPMGINNMTPGTYKVKYVSGGPSNNVRNPEQEKNLNPNETIEFVLDFEAETKPEPEKPNPEQLEKLSLEIFREMNEKYPNDSFEKIKPQIEAKYKIQLVQIGPTYDKWKLAAVKTEEFRGFLIPSLKNHYNPNWIKLTNQGTINYLYNIRGYSDLIRKPTIKNFILLPEVLIRKSKTITKVGAQTEEVFIMGPPWKQGVITD